MIYGLRNNISIKVASNIYFQLLEHYQDTSNDLLNMHELQKEQIKNGKLLDLKEIETCSYGSTDGIESNNQKMTDIYKRYMHNLSMQTR